MDLDEDTDFSEESETDLSSEIYTSNENYILSFHVSENLRQIFCLFLIVVNFVSINCGVIFMILSWYVSNSLVKQITFLQDYYQPTSVPAILLVSGLAMVLASLLGMKAAIGGRSVEDSTEAKSAAFYFFMYFIGSGVVVLLILVATCVLFGDIRVLREALGKGLKSGMERYIKNGNVKAEIDLLQIDYKCCGVQGYKDWYRVSWVNGKYLDKYDSGISR